MRQRRQEAKNRDVEVLRAVAISFVMLSHWAPHALARVHGVGERVEAYTGLWSGVDLFFCVSGYVITLSLLRQPAARGGFRSYAAPFWIRRLFRLWPSAWLWAAVTVALSFGLNATGLFGTPARTAIDAGMAVLNLANFHEFTCLGNHDCGALRVYWSLSLEEQFYWVFPFAVFFCNRRLLVVLLITIALSQLFVARPMAFMTEMPDLAWLVRTDAICLGALIALATQSAAYDGFKSALLRAPRSVSVSAGVLLVVLATAAGPGFQLSLATGLLAVVSALLVAIASCDCGLILPRLTGLEVVLMWLGARSYSLYLVHDIGNVVAAEVRARVTMPFGGMAWALYSLALTVGLTAILAEFNYRCIESPLRRYGREVASVRPPP